MYDIIVQDVTHVHDCAGRKIIYVSSQSNDETTPSKWRLVGSYLRPDDKLALSTVSKGDCVSVILSDIEPLSLVVGEFIHVKDPNVYHRNIACVCGTPVKTDGYDLWCNNKYCALTIYTRLKRLSETSFFANSSIHGILDTSIVGQYGKEDFTLDTYVNSIQSSMRNQLYSNILSSQSQPFKMLMDPKFWGSQNQSIVSTLLSGKYHKLSLAHFLVEDLFRSFIDSLNTGFNLIKPIDDFRDVGNFYAHMVEAVNRRNPMDNVQNTLLKSFIWSLGISSLRTDVIDLMMQYEISQGYHEADCLAPYWWFLTHPDEMVRELGLTSLEAQSISREVYHRWYELVDIFSGYTSTHLAHDLFDISMIKPYTKYIQ